jgi:hypothetical protein
MTRLRPRPAALLLAITLLFASSGCPKLGGAGQFITKPGEHELPGGLYLYLSEPGESITYGYRWPGGTASSGVVTRKPKSSWFVYATSDQVWVYDGDKQLSVHDRNLGTQQGMLPIAWSLPTLRNAPKEVLDRIPSKLRPDAVKQ